MKVLQVHENNNIIGGSEVYIKSLIDALIKRNIETDWFVITPVENNIFINDSYVGTGFNNIDNAITKKYDIINIHGVSDIKVIKYFLDRYPVVRSMHEPRLICPGYGKYLVNSNKICDSKYGLHCIYKAYTEKCQLSRMPKNVIYSLQRVNYEVNIASRKYKKIIAMSEFIRDTSIDSGIQRHKLEVIPYFTSYKMEFQRFDKTQKRILFVGRLMPTKGVMELLDVLIPVLNKYDDVYLDIVGDGELRGDLINIIEEKGLHEKIILHGWLNSDQISSIYTESYLLAFTSVYPEAFGIVGIEALAHSKPVVGFDVGGVSTWLKDDYNGFLVKNKDVDSFREKIKLLLIDEGLYSSFRKNAHYSSKIYSEKEHIEKLIKVYKEAIDISEY